jgi:hypothetical protein
MRISVFPEILQMGYRYIGYEGFVQPRKGQGEAKLYKLYKLVLISITIILSATHLFF